PAEFVRDLLAKEACCEATSVRPLFCQLDQLNSVPGPDGLSLTQVWREKGARGDRQSMERPLRAVMEARRQLDSGLTLLMKVDSDDGPAGSGRTEVHRRGGRSQTWSPGWARTPLRRSSGCCSPGTSTSSRKLRTRRGECRSQDEQQKYRKKVHKDAEGCSIMVGAVQTLRAPVSVFVQAGAAAEGRAADGNRSAHPFLYLLLGPKPSALSDLVAVATLMTDEIFHKVAYLANSKVELIAEAEHEHRHADQKEPQEPAVVEHGEAEGLQRTGRLFGGLVQDVKRRAPWYKSDFLDALHPQTIGLVLVFETIVFKMCATATTGTTCRIPLWIGMWTALLLLVTVALDLSYLLVIFVYEALAKLFKISSDYPHEVIVECECLPNDNLTELIPVPPKMAVSCRPTGRQRHRGELQRHGLLFLGPRPVLEDLSAIRRSLGRPALRTLQRAGRFLSSPACFIMPRSFLCYTLKKARASSLFPPSSAAFISDFAVNDRHLRGHLRRLHHG
uniref:Ion_trans domain-containing protein n=1 Tax=Macrostomum lignano TaxID=282301 RepID=A0A1I8FAK9_9PLAT